MSDETSFLAPGPLPHLGADFHIISPLGRIGDGLVYTAREELRQARLREYAPPGLVARGPDVLLRPRDPRFEPAWREGIARFLEQGARLAQIAHPGVVQAWRPAGSAGGDAPAGFLVTAPAGEPLGAALARGLPLSPAGIVRIASELAAALAEIHARGLTHLDISPDTVSIASGRVQLTDFGVDDRGLMPLLQSQAGLVRPGFSPIEMYDGNRAEPLGPPADIYAASALIFALVTGRPPAPWQERWRDPASAQLSDREAYPPAFIEAVQRGLAIEPDERFRDGTEWLAALSGSAIGRSAAPHGPAPAPARTGSSVVAPTAGNWTPVVTPVPAPVSPRAQPPAAPPLPPVAPGRSGGLLPLLVIGLILLALAVGGLYAYQQGWFSPAADDPAENGSQRRTERSKEQPREEGALPAIQLGGTVSGQLTRRDRRRPSGQYQDSFAFAGRAGQRVELRLGSADFDPLLGMTGPGFSASNDDDAEAGTTNSRLSATLPRTGSYTITVSSYAGGQTGNYVLEVAEPRAGTSIVTPAMLAGRWRRASDIGCTDPAEIVIDGPDLEYTYRDLTTGGRILDGIGRTIRVQMEEGPDSGGEAAFLMAEDGGSFSTGSETWLRC